MDTIDHIYYINLDYRTDRRAHFENWLSETNVPADKVTRIAGIHTPGAGHRGCFLTHILALEQFLDSPHDNCLIFEDDFNPLDKDTFWDSFQTLASSRIEYDVVLCAYNLLQSEDTDFPWLKRVRFSYTASGYLITRAFAPTLRKLWEDSFLKLDEYESINRKKADHLMHDVVWMELMKSSRFYCVYPRLGKQIDSYSDLQCHVTSYDA